MRSDDAPEQHVHSCDDALIVACQTLCAMHVHLIQQRSRIFKIGVFSRVCASSEPSFLFDRPFCSSQHTQEQQCFAMEVQALPTFDFSQSSFKISSRVRSHIIPATDDRTNCIQEGPLGHHCRLILLVVEFGEVCSRPAVILLTSLGSSVTCTCAR